MWFGVEVESHVGWQVWVLGVFKKAVADDQAKDGSPLNQVPEVVDLSKKGLIL